MSRWREAVDRFLPPASGLALAALALPSWRDGAASLTLFALALTLRAPGTSALATGLGYAFLAARGVSSGGDGPRLAVLLLCALLVLALIVRGGRWPPLFVAAVAAGGAGAAALPLVTSWLASAPLSRAPGLSSWPHLVAAFCSALLFFSREPPVPRASGLFSRLTVLAGLLIAGALGLWRLERASAELAAAKATATAAALESAARAAHLAGWDGGETEARVEASRAFLAEKDPSRALSVLPASTAPGVLGAKVRALIALHRDTYAMEASLRILASGADPAAFDDAVAARAGLWMSRQGKPALNLLSRGFALPGAERFLVEAARRESDTAVAATLLDRARDVAPASADAACAIAAASPSGDNQALCSELSPGHVASSLGLPPVEASFGGLVRVVGARVASPLRAGQPIGFEAELVVLATLAPGERWVPYAYLSGPGYLPFEVTMAPPAWVAGARVRVASTGTLAPQAPGGRWTVHLAFEADGHDVRLPLDGAPGHVRFADVASTEVVP